MKGEQFFRLICIRVQGHVSCLYPLSNRGKLHRRPDCYQPPTKLCKKGFKDLLKLFQDALTFFFSCILKDLTRFLFHQRGPWSSKHKCPQTSFGLKKACPIYCAQAACVFGMFRACFISCLYLVFFGRLLVSYVWARGEIKTDSFAALVRTGSSRWCLVNTWR